MKSAPRTVIIDDPRLTPAEEQTRAQRVRQMIERGEITLLPPDPDMVNEILAPYGVAPLTVPLGMHIRQAERELLAGKKTLPPNQRRK